MSDVVPVQRQVPPPRPGGARIFRGGAIAGFFAVLVLYWLCALPFSEGVRAPSLHPVTGRPIALAGQKELDSLRYLDANWYLDIAENGYHVDPIEHEPNVVFFPLWPFLMRAASSFTGQVPARCGAILNAFFVMLAAGGTALVAHRFRGGTKDGAVAPPPVDRADFAAWAPLALALALLVHPMAVFQHALYPESLFLALLAGLLLAHERGRLGLVATAAFLLALTRPQGMFVPIAFIMRDVLAGFRPKKWRLGKDTIAAGLGAGLGVAAFAAFLNKLVGDPWIFYTGQARWYGHALSLWNIPRAMLPEFSHDTIVQRAMIYFGLAGAFMLWRRGERLTACLVTVFLVIPLRVGDFGDYQRYSLPAIYAVFPWLEKLGKRPLGLAVYFTVSAMLAGFYLVRFLGHRWVG